jgi:hypothetical protein
MPTSRISNNTFANIIYTSVIQYDYLKTILSPQEETSYFFQKANSPFAQDSGIDYDYRGFYKKYGNLSPQATNGHLTDEFKLPNHPTFSVESRYYNGQPQAIDWKQKGWNYAAEKGWL